MRSGHQEGLCERAHLVLQFFTACIEVCKGFDQLGGARQKGLCPGLLRSSSKVAFSSVLVS
mgnify:CR=1 FL=1